MSWDPYTTPINYFRLSGEKSPGIATIEGADRMRKLDERNGYGLSGAWVIYNGLKLAHFTARVRLYSKKDWADWVIWRPLVQKVPKVRFTADGRAAISGKGLGPMDFWHPLTVPLGIKSVIVENEVQPILEDDSGVWMVEIKFCQYNPPKVSLAKAQGTQSKAPPDANEARMLANGNEIFKLGQELAK